MSDRQTVFTAVEVDGVEREVEATFWLYPAEKQTRDCPGCPATYELDKAVYEDTGEAIPEAVEALLDLDELGEEALTKANELDEGAREAALEAKWEAMREDY